MAADDDSRTVRLEVPARPDYVVLGRLALSAVCRLTPLAADDVADLKLAITEAAAAFVGEGGGPDLEETGAPEDVAELDGAAFPRLSFAFELGERQLAVEIGGSGGILLSGEERELGRAIIEATVDDCEVRDDTMRLVKLLGAAPS